MSTFFNIDIVTEFEDVIVAEDELSPGTDSRDDGASNFGTGLDEKINRQKNMVSWKLVCFFFNVFSVVFLVTITPRNLLYLVPCVVVILVYIFAL